MSNEKKISENVSRIQERIISAAESSGRQPDDVSLVAVTKYVDSGVVEMLYDAGLRFFGESRPQVLWEKFEQFPHSDAQWHLVGHLQRNKVKRTLPMVSMIHSVDSLRLLNEIDRASVELQRSINVLLEVNISGETAKHGLQHDQLKELIDRSIDCEYVSVCGLMGMGGLASSESEIRKEFASLRHSLEKLQNEYAIEQVNLNQLSMGMSSDFELAIAEGATLVRVGSVLFEGIER